MRCLSGNGVSFLGVVVLAVATAVAGDAKETEYVYEKDISYLSGDEAASDYAKAQCRLDLYYPKGAKGFPTIVYYHGGGLRNGRKGVPRALRNKGWAVAGVGYRLHPKVRHPVYIEDSAAGLAWVFGHIEEYGGDPEKIFVTGISAGGYLTAMVGLDKSYLAKHDVDANRIAGLIPVTGQMITHQTVRKEQGVEPSRLRPTIDRYAPLYHIRKDAPPTLCITGGWGTDILMRAEENLYFVRMMELIGHKSIEQVVIEGANHSRCGKECWPHVIAFIEKTLAVTAKPKAEAQAGEPGK